MPPRKGPGKWIASLADKIGLFVYKLAPGYTNKKIDSLLLIPQKTDSYQVKVPRGLQQLDLKTRDGQVKMYKTGKGPCVVCVHGWNGGAYQFFPLMRGLAQIGFTAIAFDHLGHGLSDAKPATLQQFIDTTNEVLLHAKNKEKEGLYAVLAHATGCIAVANAKPPLIRDLPLFMISPVFNYRLFFLKRLVKLKYHPELLKQYAAQFSKSYKSLYQHLELARHLTKYADTTVIAQDASDSESPLVDSEQFCKQNPITKLLVTREYDHNRVINSESVWQELKSHLNYEDTTINFIDQLNKM